MRTNPSFSKPPFTDDESLQDLFDGDTDGDGYVVFSLGTGPDDPAFDHGAA